jgi:hypothetical protein
METTTPTWAPGTRERVLFDEQRDLLFRRTDRMFAVLMVCQLLAAVAPASRTGFDRVVGGAP